LRGSKTDRVVPNRVASDTSKGASSQLDGATNNSAIIQTRPHLEDRDKTSRRRGGRRRSVPRVGERGHRLGHDHRSGGRRRSSSLKPGAPGDPLHLKPGLRDISPGRKRDRRQIGEHDALAVAGKSPGRKS
jgi:hypothetical protein